MRHAPSPAERRPAAQPARGGDRRHGPSGHRDRVEFGPSVHAEIIPLIRKGVVTRCETGVNGLIGELASKGEIDFPIVVRSHGGRARSLVAGDVPVDVTFIAAPCCDETGNLQRVSGPSACGSLGYAYTDARVLRRRVVAVTTTWSPTRPRP